jgi:hypothetical protein
VEHGLGGAHDEHEVGLEKRRMRARVGRDRNEAVVLRVVDEDVSAERSCLGRRQQLLELALACPAHEPSRDENRLAPVRDAGELESLKRRGKRPRSRIVLRPGNGERRGLDDDGGAPTASDRGLQWRPREREPERVPDGGRDVDDVRWGQGRPEDDVVVTDGNEDEARAGEQRDATRQAADDTVARCRRRP